MCSISASVSRAWARSPSVHIAKCSLEISDQPVAPGCGASPPQPASNTSAHAPTPDIASIITSAHELPDGRPLQLQGCAVPDRLGTDDRPLLSLPLVPARERRGVRDQRTA